MKKAFCFCVTLFIFSLISLGQIVNVENKRLYSDSLGWSGSINASFTFAQTKEQLFTSAFMPQIQRRGQKNYFLAFGSSEFSKSPTTTYTNAQLIHLRYWYDLKGFTKWEVFTQAQYNPLINLQLRELIGTGLRFEPLKKEKQKLFFGTSYMLEYEDIQPDREYNINNRWSNYSSWYLETKANISFSGVVYFQPRIDDFRDFRFSFQTSVISQLNKRVIIRFNFSEMYDSQPPFEVRNFIFNSNLSLGFLIG